MVEGVEPPINPEWTHIRWVGVSFSPYIRDIQTGARAVSFLHKLWRDEAGAATFEYGLILALAAVISVPSFEALGGNLSFVMQRVAYAECKATEVLCVMVAPE